MGFDTHLFFIGNPNREGWEVRCRGKLVLHRWCQWISECYPEGVYQGEEDKLSDFTRSIPSFVVDKVARPAIMQGKSVVIMAEEWQTAQAVCDIGDLLRQVGLREEAMLLWNANNTYSFDRIDWARLDSTTTITTVSRYMKFVMRSMGLEPLVIPNGIPRHLTETVDAVKVKVLKSALNAHIALFKMARWDPAKGWLSAVEAGAGLKAMGCTLAFAVRGGMEPYGDDVLRHARSLGLRIRDVKCASPRLSDQIRCLTEAEGGDLLNLEFFVPPELARLLYASAHGVLANSHHEPFGLVALEAMAAGGVAYVGSTGEEYARPMENAVVLDTTSPEEIISYALYLKDRPEQVEKMRRRARETAWSLTWDKVITHKLLPKLELLASGQGLLARRKGQRAHTDMSKRCTEEDA